MIKIRKRKRPAEQPATAAGTQSMHAHDAKLSTSTAVSEVREVQFHTTQTQSGLSADDVIRVKESKPVKELRSVLNGIRGMGEELRGLRSTLKEYESKSKWCLEDEKGTIEFLLRCLEEHNRQGLRGGMYYYDTKDGQVIREIYLGRMSMSDYLEMKMRKEDELRRVGEELGRT
jgi:hypothetical protein